LNATMEAAYTAAGGQHGIHFLSSTPMAAPTSYVPRQNQTDRVLQVGDVVICELSAGVGGYNGQIHRPLAMAQEPTLHYRELYEVAVSAYEAIVAVLRAGAQVKDVLDAADVVAARGLTVCDDLLHGYGAGYLAPVVRTRQTAQGKQAAEDFTFRANMAVVVQPNVIDSHTGAGLQVGNLLRVTTEGCETLQQYPMNFAICR
jgi:Xaa-Pro dipeptidase